MIEQLELPNQERKTLIALLNGVQTQSPIELKVLDSITMIKLNKLLTRAFKGVMISRLRIFSEYGCELFDEDVPFLSNGQVFFVSPTGDDFDTDNLQLIYDVLRDLGSSQSSKVQLCQHKFTKKLVSLKYVGQSNYTNTEEIESAQHQDEIQRYSKHPRLVEIYHIIQLDHKEILYIMEYMIGGNLKTFLNNQGKLPEDQARNLFLQVVSGLQYCHSRKLLHKNLKLENILLTDLDGQNLKLVDMGIVDSNIANLKENSLKYMAPELLKRKRPNFSVQSDVWALGVILFQLVFNEYPFKAGSIEQIRDQILEGTFNLPRGTLISSTLKNLFSKIFEVDPLLRINLVNLVIHPWCRGLSETFDQIQRSPSMKFTKINRFSILRRSTSSQCLMVSSFSTHQEQVTPRLKQYESSTHIALPRDSKIRLTSIDNAATLNSNRTSVFKKSGAQQIASTRNIRNYSSQNSFSTKVQQSQLSSISISNSLSDLLNKDFNKVLQKFPNKRGTSKVFDKRLSDGQLQGLPSIDQRQKKKSIFYQSSQAIQSPKANLVLSNSNQSSTRFISRSQAFSQTMKISPSQVNQVKVGFYKRFFGKVSKEERLRSNSGGQKSYIVH